jgi:hypothetical protein
MKTQQSELECGGRSRRIRSELVRQTTCEAGAKWARFAERTGDIDVVVCGKVCCLVSEQLALSFGFPVRV